MPHAMIIYNPVAGRYPSRLLTERAAAVFQDAGWQVSLEQSMDGEHITRMARQAAAEGAEYFIVAGGDGSLNYALPGLAGSQTALAVLPSGTANVWAQELGLPGLTWTRWLALEESARQLVSGEVIQVDIGRCNDRHFLLWAGVGLDAFIVHRIEPRQRWEKHFAVVQYAASIVWHAAYWHGTRLHVEVEGETMEGHFLLGLVSNVHLYAGGLANLSPQACLDDGQMDLWLFEGETLGDTVQLTLDLLSGQHVQSPRVHRRSFRNLQIHSDTPAYVQVDGDPADSYGPLHIQVLPKALHVLVPAQTPRPLVGQPVSDPEV